MIDITFPINPKPIQSTKFARMGKFTKTYEPKENRDYKGQIKYLAMKHMEENDLEIITGPVRIVKLEYRFAPPKSFSKKRVEQIKNGVIIYKSTRPDLMDNLNKGVLDALQGTFYTDDGQIVESLLTRKIYSITPSIQIVLMEV